ncbi:hypothetical protein BGX29_009602 [Mortierella sp. GBA35]|nr:hypothetical protein BGX29_009602 [Mortierella sp. GBA35]
MKLYGFVAALLLASQVQARGQPAFGPHFGVSYVYAILTSVVHDILELVEHTKPDRGKVNYFVQVGFNGIGDDGEPVSSGESSGMDGPFPYIKTFSKDAQMISMNFDLRLYLDKGEFGHQEAGVLKSTPHYKLEVMPGETDFKKNAVCISIISVVPDDKSPTSAYALTSEIIISMDPNVGWYFSGHDEYVKTPSNDCRAVRIPGTCVWFSQMIKKEYNNIGQLELNNIPEYVGRASEPVPRLPLASNFKIKYAQFADVNKAKRADPESEFDYAVSGFQSAKFLCDTVAIVPRQFSKREELRTSSPLKVRPFAATTPRTNQALTKRADCVSGVRKTSLNAGESLGMNDYLAGSGSFRLVSRENGDLIVYDAARAGENPASIAIWSLGADADSGSYFAELKLTGQLCSRSTTGILIKCIGTKSPENKAYQLTIDDNGYLYVKNGAQVVWTTNPRSTTSTGRRSGSVVAATTSVTATPSVPAPTTKWTAISVRTTTDTRFLHTKRVALSFVITRTTTRCWWLGGDVYNGPFIMKLGYDGNLCVERKGGAPLTCTNVYKPVDQYLLYIQDNGYAYVYGPDGKGIWESRRMR